MSRTTEPLVSDRQMRILIYIAKSGTVTRRQIDEAIGLSSTQSTTTLMTLISRGQIVRMNNDGGRLNHTYRLSPALEATLHAGTLLESAERPMLEGPQE